MISGAPNSYTSPTTRATVAQKCPISTKIPTDFLHPQTPLEANWAGMRRAKYLIRGLFLWWPGAGSNRRPSDFQSAVPQILRPWQSSNGITSAMQPEDQCCVMSPVLADEATGPLLDALILVAVEKQTPMSGTADLGLLQQLCLG